MRKCFAMPCALALAVSLQVPIHGHHTAIRLSIPVPGCGWGEGDSLRDRKNLSEFCQRWIPARLGIRMAAADHEIVRIEASPELVVALRDDSDSAAALLRDWLQHWRGISGYRTASIVLMRNHTEIAKVYSTMSGDVVTRR
jgi:hypothetical protein